MSKASLPTNWGTKAHNHESFYHLAYVVSGSAVWTVDGEPPYTDGEIDLDSIGREDLDEEDIVYKELSVLMYRV